MSLKRIALAAAATALVWTACCLALALQSGLPEPSIHDEFSYLLGADTFLHGRLANPPHPMRRFFEAPHILMEPHYASKYPPGQSLILALGKKLFGEPWYGVLLSGALMMFLITMVCATRASLWPGLSVAIIFGLLFLPPMYWTYSYWGGCLAAAGGAAVLLSFDFYRRSLAAAAGLIFASGVLIILVTRPYEGVVFTMAALAADCLWLYRERGKAALQGAGAFLSTAAPVLAAGLIWCAFYNSAITGHALQFPHLLYDARFNAAPIFWFLPARPELHYSNARLAALQGPGSAEFQQYLNLRSAPWYRPLTAALLPVIQYLGSTLALLVALPFAWRDRRVRSLALMIALSVVGLSLTTVHFAHYAAPVIAAFAALCACAVQCCWQFRMRGARLGTALTALLLVTAATVPLQQIFRAAFVGFNPQDLGHGRAQLVARLKEADGDHLVFVHYPSPDWQVIAELVYNSAEIDSQRIVFARDLGAEENEELLRYYPSRHPWLASFNATTLRLAPYALTEPRPGHPL